MKILLLHGAILNAGDFLIANRAMALLKHFYPDAIITDLYRNQDLTPYLETINSNDIMVIAGGPGYVNGFYPNLMPLCGDLDNIKIPIMILGMGWSGVSESPFYVYNYKFSEPMLQLLKRATSDTKILGCRDYITANMLRNNGFDAVSMTGCPAWYNLDFVSQTMYTGPTLSKCKNICISDCAQPRNLKQLSDTITFVRKFFADANVTLVFHRGTAHLNQEFVDYVNTNNIGFVDISKSAEGLAIYDNCDLHIGYRVHAHIYNLSRRNLSILIEEDSRGIGVNLSLGLEHIPANIDMIKDNSLIQAPNQHITLQLEDYIFNLDSSNYQKINSAFKTMYDHFSIMENHIKSIKNFV